MGITYISPHCNPLLTLFRNWIWNGKCFKRKWFISHPISHSFYELHYFCKVRRPIKGTSHSNTFLLISRKWMYYDIGYYLSVLKPCEIHCCCLLRYHPNCSQNSFYLKIAGYSWKLGKERLDPPNKGFLQSDFVS